MNKEVIIIGASGHGKVIADIVLKSGDRIVGFLDDNSYLSEKFIGFSILGGINNYKKYKQCLFVIAIGDAVIREKIVNKMKGANWYTAIHPSAIISSIDVEIGMGTVVMANAVINSGTKIGKHCIINTSAVVEHDNYIEDFVHISVGAKLAGTIHVGKNTWIGIGANVSNNLSICENCMIGAGAVIIKNIEKAGTYVGVPVKQIRCWGREDNNEKNNDNCTFL